MINFIIRKFIPDYENITDKNVRERYSVLAGVLGIFNNFILFALKIIIGFYINSIAVISDAFNNLSDIASSLLSVISAKMSNMRPDKEHPFGHGRIEYVASLFVAAIIFFVGISLFKTSVSKIFRPETLNFNPYLVLILALSVLVKVWMFFYNRYIGKKINSSVLCAAAEDSLSDVWATSAVIVSTVLGLFTTLPLDAILGVGVSVLILLSGFGIAKDTIDLLLGKAPDKELVEKLKNIILNGERIQGVHDLIVHDYGPGRVIASAHAEVKDTENIVEIHEIIDALENKIEEELGVVMIIHTDPINVDCERTISLKNKVEEIAEEIDENLTIHDFRITDGKDNINLIFDIVFPYEYDDKSCHKIVFEIMDKMKSYDSRINIVAKIDRTY